MQAQDLLTRSNSFDTVFGAKNKSKLNKNELLSRIGQKHRGTHYDRRKCDISEFVGFVRVGEIYAQVAGS